MQFDDFVQTLVAIMEADGNTSYVDNLLTNSRAQVTAGNGAMTVTSSATINGKTFEKKIDFSYIDTVRACLQALMIYNDTDDIVPVTYPSFRDINR